MTKTNNSRRKNFRIEDNCLSLQPTLELTKMKLIALDSIFKNYPFLKNEMSWTKADIELFYETHLILGEQKEDGLYIDTITLEMLIEYHRKLNNKKN